MCKAYTAAASECPSPGGRAGPRHEQGMLLVLALLHRAQPDSGRAAAAAPGSSAEPNHPAATRHGGDTALGSRQLRAGPSSAGAAGPGRPLPPHLRTAHAARNGTKHGLCQKSLPSPPLQESRAKRLGHQLALISSSQELSVQHGLKWAEMLHQKSPSKAAAAGSPLSQGCWATNSHKCSHFSSNWFLSHVRGINF